MEESILLQDKAKADIKSPSKKKLDQYKGTLYLTSQRLLMEAETGFISKKTSTAFAIPLSDILNVKVEGLLGKKLMVEAKLEGKYGEAKFSGYYNASAVSKMIDVVKIEFSIKNPQDWVTRISKTM
jgi:hypothetical protein